VRDSASELSEKVQKKVHPDHKDSALDTESTATTSAVSSTPSTHSPTDSVHGILSQGQHLMSDFGHKIADTTKDALHSLSSTFGIGGSTTGETDQTNTKVGKAELHQVDELIPSAERLDVSGKVGDSQQGDELIGGSEGLDASGSDVSTQTTVRSSIERDEGKGALSGKHQIHREEKLQEYVDGQQVDSKQQQSDDDLKHQ